MSIDTIAKWHERARPEPTEENLNVQFGCHIEEFVETLDSVSIAVLDSDIDFASMMAALDLLADGLKKGTIIMEIDNRKEFLDGLADQMVTAVGTAHCAKMKVREAVAEVDRSNWSKYDESGQPIFNDHGKIMKGPNYTPPNLEGMY